jgi:glycosyltransferase involved in cell wall biosynthesis
MVAGRFRDGGVEQRMNRLAAGFVQLGVSVRFVLGESGRDGAGVRIPDGVDVTLAGESFERAVQREFAETGDQDHAVLAFRTADFSSVLKRMPRRNVRPKVFLVNGDYISMRVHGRGLDRFRAWKTRRRLYRQWSRADGLITTCPEIAADWSATGAFPDTRVHHPPPPVVGPDVTEASLEHVDHPLFHDDDPVVLGVGRLVPNKRFELLIEAFSHLRGQSRARLVILGQGRERDALVDSCRECGLLDVVDFPGFTPNPYAWMRRANVLVLPSRVEPFGLVLIESLYIGTPFIAAGEPPGPRAIHDATGCGTILQRDTATQLAGAIQQELDRPTEPEALRRSAARYESMHSAAEYLEILFPSAAH